MKKIIILSALLAGCIASNESLVSIGSYQDGDTLNTKDTVIDGRMYKEVRTYWGGSVIRTWITDTTHNNEPIKKERRLCGDDKICYKWRCGNKVCHEVVKRGLY